MLIGYSDASFGTDIEDRKGVSGYLFLVNGGPISWFSKKQTIVALSTQDAEYVALSEAVRENLWVYYLLSELKISYNQVMYCDNQAAIALATNPEKHSRTKHIDIKFHFVRDIIQKKLVYLNHCASKEMLADMMTKALDEVLFELLRNQYMQWA